MWNDNFETDLARTVEIARRRQSLRALEDVTVKEKLELVALWREYKLIRQKYGQTTLRGDAIRNAYWSVLTEGGGTVKRTGMTSDGFEEYVRTVIQENVSGTTCSCGAVTVDGISNAVRAVVEQYTAEMGVQYKSGFDEGYSAGSKERY
jgi:hypothetical protein